MHMCYIHICIYVHLSIFPIGSVSLENCDEHTPQLAIHYLVVHTCVLSSYFMPDPILGLRNRRVNKSSLFPALRLLSIC